MEFNAMSSAFFTLFFSFSIFMMPTLQAKCSAKPKFSLAIHKGTGEDNAEKIAFVEKVLKAGAAQLEAGEKSIDVVESTVRALEDSGLFNAGKNAVLTAKNEVELDASIMDGSDLSAGAVASVKNIQNPISLARLVKDKTKHVLLMGRGAEDFAKQQGMKTIEAKKYFLAYKKLKTSHVMAKDYRGTVGAVALDRCGNISAATSTGGLEDKMPGRVGDSPIIGAGTYANNQTAAISATGDGEYFIRNSTAKTISDIIEFKRSSLQSAATLAIEKLTKLGGYGGVISVNVAGDVASAQNTPMTTAFIKENHEIVFLGRDFVEKKQNSR